MSENTDLPQEIELTLEQKLEKFNEYFTVEQDISVNAIAFEPNVPVPSYSAFKRNMPYSFRIASEVSSIESMSLRSLRNVGHYGDDLVDYLKAQSRKIDLILSYILTMEDEDEHRLTAHSYGGGGVTIEMNDEYEVGRLFKLKIFLTDEAAAIYCLGEVVHCEPTDDGYLIQLYYVRIREDDREVIVRGSLHQQSKQLKRLAEHKRVSSKK